MSGETLKVPGDREGGDTETAAQPDVSADRGAPRGDAEPGQPPADAKRPALPIKEIEELEDDAPGG